MNNFKLHEQAEQMAAGNSAYKLARRVIELEERLKAAMANNNKIKAEAVREAAYKNRKAIVEGGDMWLCAVDDLVDHANKLEQGEK